MTSENQRPTLTLEVAYMLDGEPQKLEAILESITLSGGREIDRKHFSLSFGKVGTANRLKRLQDLGMPMDLNRWLLVVDGEGIGQPDFAFHFLGVVSESNVPHLDAQSPAERPDAQSPLPFFMDLWDRTAKKTVARFRLGFMWDRAVFVKNSNAVLAELYDPHGRYEKTSKTGWALGIMNLASDFPTVKGRANHMRKLARGYELLVDLWEAVSKPHGGRKSTVNLEPETVRQWSAQYDTAREALEAELTSRHSKRLSKYSEIEKKAIIKRSLGDVPQDVKDGLAKFDRTSDVALQYTAWRCSGIAIATWKRDRLRDVLQQSDEENGVNRSRRSKEVD